MGSVDIGVRHADDAVIPQLGQVKLIAKAAAESRDHVFDFGVKQGFVDAGLFDIQYLAAQGHDGLKVPVTPGFGTAAG